MLRGLKAAPSVAALGDDLRRSLYEYVCRARRPVARDEVAEAAGISRKLAAFHLDKLVARGLLRARYGRPDGRAPGVGRMPKLYEPSEVPIELNLPERRYDLVGDILAAAISNAAPGETAHAAALRIARTKGEDLGRRLAAERGVHRPGNERTLSEAEAALDELGFEPFRSERGAVALNNCPFHALAAGSPELVCGINQAYIDGLLRGLGNDGVESALVGATEGCCVELRPR